MKKNESDLDEELNENLDFLEEDHHINSDKPNTEEYLPSNSTSFLNAPHKKLIIIIIGIITVIIPITLIIHNKKKNNSILNLNKQPALVASNVQPKINNESDPNKPTENLDAANNNLNWQELKKSAGTTSLEPSPNSITSNETKHSNNFEINIPIEAIEQNSQLKAIQNNSNYVAQENINELKSIVENIIKELANNANQIKDLQNHLQEISRSIGNVNNSVNSIDSRIHSIAGTVDTLSLDVKNVKKYIQEEDLDLTSSIKPSEPDLFSNTPEYVVHAIIPGRAWLKSSSGQIITVAEGDLLGDYGKISLIDTANNLVRTSSGVVFR